MTMFSKTMQLMLAAMTFTHVVAVARAEIDCDRIYHCFVAPYHAANRTALEVESCDEQWVAQGILQCLHQSQQHINATDDGWVPRQGRRLLQTEPVLDYADSLRKSMLFYQIQRSGSLPNNHPFRAWRGNSAMADAGPDGRSLVGGYYDAGDHLKLNFNLAHTVAVLAWSYMEFKKGYEAAGQNVEIIQHLRRMADFINACYIEDGQGTFVVNVGDVDADHNYWGRPEDMTMPRPAKTISRSNPGSDAWAYAAGALAATANALRLYSGTTGARDGLYANTAMRLYSFAKESPGSLYTDTQEFNQEKERWVYKSSRALDKLHFAALQLFQLTGQEQFREDARQFLAQADGAVWWPALTWDNMWPAGLITHIKRDPAMAATCHERLQAGANQWLNPQSIGSEGQVVRRPDGYLVILNWGSAGTTAGYAMIAQAYASLLQNSEPSKARQLRCMAHGQINYLLGLNPAGFSFQVGFGSNFPQRAHHRAASCSSPMSTPCNWDDFNADRPNPQLLVGALVGGPTQYGVYNDQRNDYQTNEVAVNFNAGFTGALAALSRPDSPHRCV